MPVTDEQLGAFLDGECSDAEAARIAALVEADPVLASRLAQLDADTRVVRGAFDDMLDDPVPARLVAAVRLPEPPRVVDFAAAKAARTPRWMPPLALAASVAFGVVVGAVGFNGLVFNGPGLNGLGSKGLGPDALASAENAGLVLASGDGPVAGTALAAALASARSGTTTTVAALAIKPLISFRDKQGRLCRQFDLQQQAVGSAGIACRDSDNWQMIVLATRDAGPGGGYVTAAGPGDTAIAAALDSLIAGEPLDAEAEAQALADGA